MGLAIAKHHFRLPQFRSRRVAAGCVPQAAAAQSRPMSGTATTQGAWWLCRSDSPEREHVVDDIPLTRDEAADYADEMVRRREAEIEACRAHLRDLWRAYGVRR